MARIRSIKPEFWGDRKLAASVSRDARLLYVALWNQADEWARVQGDARWIKGHCLPYDDDLNLQAIDRLVDELAAAGRVQKYDHEGDPYLFLPKLAEHQRLEPSKVPSRLPEPPTPISPYPDGGQSAPRADEAARRADEAEPIDALQVAGSRLHVAGSKGSAEPPPGAELVHIRRDVDQLCERLATRMVENGCKKPVITDRWRDSARLLLDRDKRGLDEALELVDWSQSDDFWRANVQSMPTFREQYDRLRLQSQRAGPGTKLSQQLDGAMRRAQEAEAQHSRKALP